MRTINKLILYVFLIGVFLSPYTDFLPFGVNISLFDIILILTFSLVLMVKIHDFNGKFKKKLSLEYIFLYIFIIGSVLSTVNSTSYIISILILLQYLFAIIAQKMIVSHILEYSIDHLKNLFKIINVYLISLAVVFAIGLAATFGVLPNSSDFLAGNGRLESVKGNANALAKYIAFSLPLMFAYIDLKKKSFLLYVLIALAIITLFLTASFGGMMYAAATTIYYYMVKSLLITRPIAYSKGSIFIKKSIVNLRSFSVLALASSVIIYLVSNPPKIFADRVLNVNDITEAGSASLKLNLMSEATDFITSSPLIGMGLGEYLYNSNYLTNVHNLYLLVFAEAGILGFLGLFGLLLTIFIRSFKLIKIMDVQDKYLLLSLNASLFSILIVVTTNPHTYARPTWLLIILLWALIDLIYKKKRAAI